jgi:hypothetical protein
MLEASGSQRAVRTWIPPAFAGVTNEGTDYLLSWTTGCDQPMERTGQA